MTDEIRVVDDLWTWPGTAMTGQVSVEIAALLDDYAKSLPSKAELLQLKAEGRADSADFLRAFGRREHIERRAEQLRACWVES